MVNHSRKIDLLLLKILNSKPLLFTMMIVKNLLYVIFEGDLFVH